MSIRLFFPSLFLGSLLSCQCALSQTSLVTCTTERNSDNSITLYADSRIFGDYTLKLTFPTLIGYKASGISVLNDQAVTTITKGKREVAKLTPDKMAASFSFSYRYLYIPGMALKRPPADTSFPYLLPGSAGNTLRVLKVVNISETIGVKPQSDYFATGFDYHLGDTICAARAGIVYVCNDDVKDGEKGSEVFKSERNRIGIQQKDGTLAHYAMRAPIQLLITPGDEVIAGQPIAIFTKASEHYTVMFSVSYLDEKLLLNDRNNDPSIGKGYTKYLQPVFCNSYDGGPSPALMTNTNFIVTHPKQVISAEMSKREKKKYGFL